MKLDANTVFVCSALAGVAMTMILFVMHQAKPDEPGLLTWLAVVALHTVFHVIGLLHFFLNLNWNWDLFRLAVNTLFCLSHSLILVAVQQHLRKRPNYALVFGAMAVLAVALNLPPAQESLRIRILLFLPPVLFFLAYAAVLLVREKNAMLKSAHTALLGVIGVYGAINLVRWMFALFTPEVDRAIEVNDSVNVVGWLSDLFFVFGITMCAAMIVFQRQNMELARMAETDPLTGLLNRHTMHQFVVAEFKKSRRNGSALSLLVLDIDFFKKINDTFGHVSGDACIRQAAAILRDTLRESDHVFRFGGEEFLGVLPGTDLDGAIRLAERVRAAIGSMSGPDADHQIAFTASIGVAQVQSDDGDWEAVMRRADDALYQSKRNGRNRVTPSPEAEFLTPELC